MKYGYYQLDAVHLTTMGKLALVYGGDTPPYGLRASIKTLVAS